MCRVVLAICLFWTSFEFGENTSAFALPNYMKLWESLNPIESAMDKLIELSAYEEYNEYKDSWHLRLNEDAFHFGVLVAVVNELSNQLLEPCPPPYDEIYLNAVREGLNQALKKESGVVDSLKRLFKTTIALGGALKNLTAILENNCNNETDAAACNSAVNEKLCSQSYFYDAEIDILRAFGDVANEFLKDTFEKEIKEFNVMKLLARGKDRLRKLVGKVVVLKRLFRNFSEQTCRA